MIELTDNNFKEEISKGDVVVDCWANWCGVCKMMKPKYEEFANSVKNIKFCTLDVDKAPQISSELGISNLPTIIIYKDGKEVTRGSFDVLNTLV